MSIYVKLRYILKAVSAAAWVIVLPVTYAYSWKNPPGFAQTIKTWFGNSPSSPSLFILAVLIYLSPNMLCIVLFLFPFIRRFLEGSNNNIVMLMMWWSQVCRCMFLNFFSDNCVYCWRPLLYTRLWIWYLKLICSLLFNLFSFHTVSLASFIFHSFFQPLVSCSLGSMLEGQCMRAQFLL